MNCEILSVGTELLLGTTVNTDASELSLMLAEMGVNVYWHSVVGDNPGRLREAVALARSRAELIITTGGLGPTCDDLTKTVLAEAFGLSMEYHPEEEAYIRARLAASGRPFTDNNLQQAWLPVGCHVLHNDWGTAPGCAFETGGVTVVMLPGPPHECCNLFRHVARPWLAARVADGGAIVSRNLRIFGIGESDMEARLRPRMLAMQNPTLAPYAKEAEVLLRVTAKAASEAEAAALCEPVVESLRQELGGYVYGVDEPSLEALCLRLLTERGMTLAAAESCTGGLLSKRLTDVPGASAAFLGGAVTYTESVKERLALVPAETIERHSVVSREVALAMAHGIRENLAADFGVGITGLAGPDGDGVHPVGTVFIALSAPDGAFCRHMRGGEGRSRNRLMAVNHALDMIRRYLTGLPVVEEDTNHDL